MKEDLKKLKGLNFYFTDDMKQTLFDMMAIQKMLETESLDKTEREQLEREKERLLKHFRSELHANNPVEVSIVRAFLNMKYKER